MFFIIYYCLHLQSSYCANVASKQVITKRLNFIFINMTSANLSSKIFMNMFLKCWGFLFERDALGITKLVME